MARSEGTMSKIPLFNERRRERRDGGNVSNVRVSRENPVFNILRPTLRIRNLSQMPSNVISCVSKAP